MVAIPSETERRQADKQLLAAHRRVLAHWPEEAVRELNPLVIHDAFTEPDAATELEREFYAERREAMKDIRLEPVSFETISRKNVPVEWTAVVDKGGD
ncbi:hypothetical protein [Haloarcula rubripromontorii]|uniref:hypothetical protein n=1 Tax=Haloarcula rubripromontorii TaxID=1705562 RepID=UPI00345BCD63